MTPCGSHDGSLASAASSMRWLTRSRGAYLPEVHPLRGFSLMAPMVRSTVRAIFGPFSFNFEVPRQPKSAAVEANRPGDGPDLPGDRSNEHHFVPWKSG